MNKSTLSIVCGLLFMFSLSSGIASAQDAYTKLCLQAIDLEKQGKLDEAINKYNEAIKLKPGEWSGYNYKAKINLYRQRYEDAIADISTAISMSPKTLSLYAVRADCYNRKGDYDKALTDYNMALSNGSKSKEEDYQKFSGRGFAYFKLNRYQEAVSDLSQAIVIADKYKKPTNILHYNRAMSYMEMKAYSSAIPDFDIYLTSDPNDEEAVLYQGYAYMKTGDNERAKASAEKVLKIDPSKEIFFSGDHLLGIYNFDQLRDKAKQLIKSAKLSISEQASLPSKAMANMVLRDAFMDLDTAWLYIPDVSREDKILRDTIRSEFFIVYPQMKQKPELPEAIRKYAVQATNATQEKNYDDAIRLWNNTIEMAPYFPVAYYNRALLYEVKGFFPGAINDMKTYIKLSPDAQDARSAQDKIYGWDAKMKDFTGTQSGGNHEAINHLESGNYSAGNFVFAFSVGGGFGLQVGKNPGLEKIWASNFSASNFKYTDKMPFLYSGNMEMVFKPAKRIGLGGFGNWAGGIGCRTTVSGTKYILDMGSVQYGGLIRCYIAVNDGANKPDFYAQYAIGQTKISGMYAVATMDGIIYNYSLTKNLKGTGPYNSFGVGMGGKVNKHGYVTMSLDYIYSKVKNLDWDYSKGGTGTGTYKDVNACFNGFELKFLFGFCL